MRKANKLFSSLSSLTKNMKSILENPKLKHYVCAKDIPVCRLEVASAFKNLTDKEKKYAHYIERASWAGTRIVLRQTSEESLKIFDLLQNLFKDVDIPKLQEKSGVDKAEFQHLLEYAAQFYGNLGNYLSFGDTKFIPRISPENFEKIVQASGNETAQKLFNEVKSKMYSLKEGELELGFGKDFTNSTYYSPNVTKQEAEDILKFMDERNISGYNTRLFKVDGVFKLMIASANKKKGEVVTWKDYKIEIVYGDHSEELKQVSHYLSKAIDYAANEHQVNMLKCYVKHFNDGDIEDHKDSQRHWIKDIGPVVETNIGFIESYRDPLRVRGEWEGFVAIVNKETSKKYAALVDNSTKFIKMLPYNKDTDVFEAKVFKKPDFTSLEVSTFCSSGIPAGINIPNYDDIRCNEGFKNVSLANVLNAQAPNEKITFILEEDLQLFKDYRGKAFGVQVAIHELLGHGSGRLLEQDKDGKFNFDPKTTINPLTNKPIETYYKFGETFNSVFKDIKSSYEECRAECTGIYLCVVPEILKIFDYEGEEAEKIIYVNWLLMCRAGLLALEFYSPDTKNWLQAHMQARFAILQRLLETKKVVEIVNVDGNTFVKLNKDAIKEHGVPAIGDFLTKLNIYKATADVKNGRELYEKYTTVSDEFLKLREEVLAKKQPRKVFVQPHTILKDDQVELIEFEASYEGMIKSFQTRFK